MEMAQMVIQGMWERDSVLTQIPHVTAETAARAKAHDPPVETIFDLIDMEVSCPSYKPVMA
jgi:pre-mRNA-splicing helicase BRR2